MRTVAIGAVAALTAGMALCSPTGASASAPGPAKTPTAGGSMVRIPGSLHPFAVPSADAGRADPGQRLTNVSLLFRMTPAQKMASTDLQIALQDSMSPRYHRWLTPEQYAAQFGASAADIARATAWLKSQGLDVIGPSRLGTRLAFNGTVAQIERALQTEIHLYDVDGVRHFGNSVPPSVPADLGRVVMGVHNLHDFKLKAPRHTVRPYYNVPQPIAADGGLEPYPATAPADFAKIYGLDTLYANHITGTGQHIAIAGETEFNDADIANFRTTFGLSTTGSVTCQGSTAICPTRHLVPNSGNPYYSEGDLTESSLDLEWAGAVAPDATIDFVYTGDNSAGGVFDALLYAIEEHIAPIVSVSYGGAEGTISPTDASFNEGLGDAAALTGITALAAAGDTGAADDDRSRVARNGKQIDWPGGTPTFLDVGGSEFQLTQANVSTYLDSNFNALGYIPEMAWNDTWADIDAGSPEFASGGGGVSKIFPKPYWQIPYTPSDSFRDAPDVAMTASAEIMPYIISYSFTPADSDAAPRGGYVPEGLQLYGGTSGATPSLAAILALVNQSLAAANPSAPVGLGNANPVIYALANTAATKAAFNDITVGDNSVPCEPGSPDCPANPPYSFGYAAGPGYDQATGNGSVNAATLVQEWATLTPTSTTATVTQMGTTEGSPMTLKATVSSAATSNALTGDVTFYFLTYDNNGDVDLSGVLGSVAIVPSTSGPEGGTVTLTAKAPAGLIMPDAGLNGGAKIGAVYGGDLHYLNSWSSLSAVTGTASISICPQTVTLEPLQTGFQFQVYGGTGPYGWGVPNDGTCVPTTIQTDAGRIHLDTCSSITDAGVFTAGPGNTMSQYGNGQAEVIVYDSNHAYTSAWVTVVGSADGGAPLPTACPPPVVDAGTDASTASDSGSETDATAEMDATADGGSSKSGGSSGCSCTTAGAQQGGALGGLGGALLGLAAMVRRKRSRG